MNRFGTMHMPSADTENHVRIIGVSIFPKFREA